MNSIDEIYADSIPPHQDDDSFRPKVNPSPEVPMPSHNNSERSRSQRRHRSERSQSQDSISDMRTDFDTAVTSQRSTIPITSNSPSVATISERSRSGRGNSNSRIPKRTSKDSQRAPGALDSRTGASSSHERPSVTPAVPVSPNVTLPIRSNTTSSSSQPTIPYENDNDSEGPPSLVNNSDDEISDTETIAEFQGYFDEVDIPFEEPSVPAFWDTCFQTSYLAQSHPLRRPLESEQLGNYNDNIQFELPPTLSCWLVNPVFVPEGHV